jgi:hypothetical protein
MPQSHKTGTKVAAFSLENLPNRDDFYLDDFCADYDLSLLEACQIPVQDIAELGEWAIEAGLPQVSVIFCEMPNVKGEVDADGLIPWQLIFLNTGLHTSVDDLRESYLHELAHFNDINTYHGLRFSTINNVYRLYAGFGISEADWDYSDCDIEDRTMEEVKSLSSTVANHLYERKVPICAAVKAVEWLFFGDPDRKWDREGLVKSLDLIISCESAN